jgi:prepilin-type processing-associated H-X9-DG protein
MASPPKSDRSIVALVSIAAIVLIAIIAGLVLLASRARRNPTLPRPSWRAVGFRSSAAAQTAVCESNLKQLALALLIYCGDHNDKTPPAGDWAEAISPYTRTWNLYLCPAQFPPPSTTTRPPMLSYALNAKAAGSKGLNSFANPAGQILFFETASTQPAPLDAGKSLVKPGRHFHGGVQGNNYAFLDGHVKLCPDSAPPPF